MEEGYKTTKEGLLKLKEELSYREKELNKLMKAYKKNLEKKSILEAERKQDLINKLNPEKDMSEVIELPIKKEEFIANANKEKTSDDDFELPKLK
jgi:hypothetical protein